MPLHAAAAVEKDSGMKKNERKYGVGLVQCLNGSSSFEMNLSQ